MFLQAKGNKERKFFLSKKFNQDLWAFIQIKTELTGKSSEYVFDNGTGGKYKKRSVQNLIKKLCDDCKIQKNITPHSFRRSFATYKYRNDRDLQGLKILMGHENISTTQKYILVDLSELKKQPTTLDLFEQ